jgi:GNAT superfamily N-acetyltransferase
MNTRIVLVDAHEVEMHDAFLRFVPEVFPSICFRRWYELGGWSPDYRAFALVDGERIIANVSVQRMKLIVEGRERVGWQLGAVGVLPDYRGRGFQRRLMQHVLAQLNPKDVVLLFANEEALEFYPLFGFRRATEWLHCIEHSVEPGSGSLRRLSIDSAADRELFARLAARALPVTERFGARDYGAVLFWYWAGFHANHFYYHEADDAIVVAEQDMEVLRILDVLAAQPIDLMSYLPQLVQEPVDHIEFGFTPECHWPQAVPECEYLESALFVRGEIDLPVRPFKFPLLAQT